MNDKTEFDERVVIAVDFDGTLTERDNFPDPNYQYNEAAMRWMLSIRKLPVVLVLWTCSGGERIQKVRNEMVRLYGLWFDYVNEYPHRFYNKKINADIYIDDRANDGAIQWDKIYGRIIDLIQQRRGNSWTEKPSTSI